MRNVCEWSVTNDERSAKIECRNQWHPKKNAMPEQEAPCPHCGKPVDLEPMHSFWDEYSTAYPDLFSGPEWQ